MAAKTLIVYFASALLVQSAFGQYLPSLDEVNVYNNNVVANNGVSGSSSGLAGSIVSNAGLGNANALSSNQANLAYSNVANNVAYSNTSPTNVVYSNGANNIAYNNAVANGISNAIISNGISNAIVSNGISGSGLNIAIPAGQFSVVSGSPAYSYPGGVSVSSSNEFGGALACSGSLPFAGSAYFDGTVGSNGQAGLSYSSLQGVGLTETGCGYGLAGQQIGGQVVSTGLANAAINAINANALNSAYPNVISAGLNLGAGSSCGCY